MPTMLRGGIALLVLLGAVWLAGRLFHVLVLVAIALLLTVTLLPVVRWLERRRVPHGIAVSLCFLAILGALAGFFAYLIPVLLEQVTQLAAALPDLVERWSAFEERWTGWRGDFPFLPRFAELTAAVTAGATTWIQQSISYTGRVLTMAVSTATVLFLAFFFVKDGARLLRQVLRLAPERFRPQLASLLDHIALRVGDYVLGRLAVSVILGVLVTIGLALVGMPYAVLLGVLVGVLDIIPYLGPFLAAAPGLLIALTHSWSLTLWVLGIYFVAQQIESYLLSPVIVGKSVGLHPAWVVLALLVGAELMGILGMVLAVPAAATLHVLLETLYLPRVEDGLSLGEWEGEAEG